MRYWLIVLILVLLVFGLWYYPNLTKSLVTGAYGFAKSLTGYVVGIVR
jgi:Sec-independent protein translocase protein TatA